MSLSRYLQIEYPDVNLVYVQLLCDYLIQNYLGVLGILLDIGSGKGDHVRAFEVSGLTAFGIDRPHNFEEDTIPFGDNSFNYIFSKSTLEHIYNTQHILTEALRVLKPKGIAVFLVPDWAKQIKCFWDDSTHVKPFTQKGLRQAFLLAGFKDVECEIFYQLPFLWRHKWVKFIPYVVALLPDCTKYRKGRQNVLIRHSKERMLLVKAIK